MNIQITIENDGHIIENSEHDYIACYSLIFPSVSFNVGDKIDLPSFRTCLYQGELYYPDPSCSYVPMETIINRTDEIIIEQIKHVYTEEHGYVLCLHCKTFIY